MVSRVGWGSSIIHTVAACHRTLHRSVMVETVRCFKVKSPNF